MSGQCLIHNAHPTHVNYLPESFPNGLTSLPWSGCCWRSTFTSFLTKTDLFALVCLGGKDEKCGRGWGSLGERARSLEMDKSGPYPVSVHLQPPTWPRTSKFASPSLCFFICKDDVLLWRLNYSTCTTRNVVPVAEQMLGRWSAVPSPVDQVPLPFPILCITVTPHILILLLSPRASQPNLWKLFSALWKRKSAIPIKNFQSILFCMSHCSLLSQRLATLVPEVPRHCSWVRNLK